jgi:phosphonate transport system ATP-binding protein
MTSPPPFLSFENVSKRFPDGTQALQNASFTVKAGEFCVILGPSGSGKSTLLRTVNGLVTGYEGTVRIEGVAVTPHTLKTMRLRTGMIYQQFNLVQRASVAHNVISGMLAATSTWRAMLGLFSEKDRTKVCELLATVGLQPEHLKRRVSQLSGGQQQRVGIARAFMNDPDLILADEPVASLDPKISRDIMSLLRKEARERNATVLCSLHQMDLAQEFADRVIAIRQGRIVYDGHPSNISRVIEASIYVGAGEEHKIEAREDQRPLALAHSV